MRDAVSHGLFIPHKLRLCLKPLESGERGKKSITSTGFSLSWFCSAGGAENGVRPLQQVGISGDLRCGFYSTAAVLGKCPCT